MSKHFLILDCGIDYCSSKGKLNHYLSDIAQKELMDMGHTVDITLVGDAWEAAAEAEKIKNADVVILQTPIWWMAPPWQFKRYQDVVFMQPAGFLTGDGRHHQNPEDNYGTGGLLTDKKYMISTTWNAPKGAFDRKDQFFEGKGIDGVMFPVHKAFQFIGMKPLPTFMCNDVIKNPKIDEDVKRWKEHLKKLFA